VRPRDVDSRATLREAIAAVSKPCPGIHEAQSAVSSARDQVFVEAAILEVSSEVRDVSLANLQDLPQMTPVQLVATPHVIGRYDSQTEMVLDSGGVAPDRLSLARWAALPRRAHGAVLLEVEIELEPPGLGAKASQRTQKFAVTVHNNEPTLARVEWDAASHRSLLVLLRTFEVHDEADLRAIFQCKMQQHAHAVARAGD